MSLKSAPALQSPRLEGPIERELRSMRSQCLIVINTKSREIAELDTKIALLELERKIPEMVNLETVRVILDRLRPKL